MKWNWYQATRSIVIVDGLCFAAGTAYGVRALSPTIDDLFLVILGLAVGVLYGFMQMLKFSELLETYDREHGEASRKTQTQTDASTTGDRMVVSAERKTNLLEKK